MCVRQRRPILIFGKPEKDNRNNVRVELRQIIGGENSLQQIYRPSLPWLVLSLADQQNAWRRS
jgi:hypothetical protein